MHRALLSFARQLGAEGEAFGTRLNPIRDLGEILMYERTYGYLYDRERSVKDDAALIRSTIKTMASAGILPSDWKYSVRYRTASMMRAIDITASSPRPIYLMEPGMICARADRPRIVTIPTRLGDRERFTSEWMRLQMQPGEMHDILWCDAVTNEAHAVRDALQELQDACNHDGSEIQVDYFDVKYYGHPVLDVLPGVPRASRPRPDYLPRVCA